MPRLYALILSGGAGTRLWPRSRRAKPKQFLDLVGDRTMLQDTVDRIAELIPVERVFVVAPPEHSDLIREQLPELRADHLVTEPYPRGNAPAIGLAMAALHAFDPEGVVAVLASDHVVTNRLAYRNVLLSATAGAEAGRLVTIGVTPTGPDTGFGYIEAGERLEIEGPVPVYAVKKFIEKPTREVAEQMLRVGGHYWNASMFVWRVAVAIEAYRRYLPRTADAITRLSEANGSPGYEQVLAEVWESTERTTIDYGIAEKADNIAVVPADIGWHDVGSWDRLADIVGNSDNRSVEIHLSEGSSGNYVYAPGRVVATVGVENLVIIDTGDALLVASRDHPEQVKAIVDRLKQEGREDLM